MAGAPRTVSPSPEECIILGEDLVKWATEPTKEWRCLFQQWYSLKHSILRKEWKTLIQRAEFMPYYEKAQSSLAVKCVNGTMKEGFGQRYIRLYDRNLVEEETEKVKTEAEIRAKLDAKPDTKFVFEVNYKNDCASPIEVSPQTIPSNSTTDSQ